MNRKLIFTAGAVILSASIVMTNAFAGRLAGSNNADRVDVIVNAWSRVKLDLGASSISCAQGKQIVRGYGFDNVRSLNCGGRTLTYLGSRDGASYAIVLNRNGSKITFDAMGY